MRHSVVLGVDGIEIESFSKLNFFFCTPTFLGGGYHALLVVFGQECRPPSTEYQTFVTTTFLPTLIFIHLSSLYKLFVYKWYSIVGRSILGLFNNVFQLGK